MYFWSDKQKGTGVQKYQKYPSTINLDSYDNVEVIQGGCCNNNELINWTEKSKNQGAMLQFSTSFSSFFRIACKSKIQTKYKLYELDKSTSIILLETGGTTKSLENNDFFQGIWSVSCFYTLNRKTTKSILVKENW